MNESINKKYSFKETESKFNLLWEDNKLYKWNNSQKNNFIIDTPPPTISGELHMGHVFSYCHTDFIARYQRMKGQNVFYPIGFDDNGLPTERLVEKKENIKAVDLSREEFIEYCNKISSESRKTFKSLFQSLGISYDWDLEYHTISKSSQILSQLSFIDLYKKGKIYRKLQPMFWDTIDQTAISQAEIEDKELSSYMNEIAFSTESGDIINIATTRPELIPACVALFFNPEDTRYKHLRGKNAIVPLTNHIVPILEDDKVKIDKGTGLVMCCTFGDELDIYWWQKHQLNTKIIIDKRGRICNIPEIENEVLNILQLKVKDARVKILELLKQNNLLINQTSIIHSVKCAERSGAPLEILSTYQWFVKVLDQKEMLLEQVKKINWYPKFMQKRIEIWIENLNWDWCISRQRYFGVPFPVWYSKKVGEEGKVILPDPKQLPVNPICDLPIGYSADEVIADTDVMDTWATSSLTPEMHYFNLNQNLDFTAETNNMIPAQLRPQSHEIIRTWAFYTIVKSLYHLNNIPWENIMISGWCLASDKTKMSKSKGNTITPSALLNTYGADVIRYWAAQSRLGVDTAFSEDLLKIGNRFTTKLWNASKFVGIFIKSVTKIDLNNITEVMDKWLLSRLYQVILGATQKLEEFEYCVALNLVEEFFWKDFCDNYLELVKKRAYGEQISKERNLSAIHTLSYALKTILLLLAPYLPYITDEIFNALYNDGSIHKQNNWPKIDISLYDAAAEEVGNSFILVLNEVRKIKAEHQVSIKHKISNLVISGKNNLSNSIIQDLKDVCNAENIEIKNETSEEDLKVLVELEM